MIIYFASILAYLLIVYSTIVVIMAPSIILAVRNIANRYFWDDDDYYKIKIAKRFLYSLFATIPAAVVLTEIVNQDAKNRSADIKHDYNISLNDVPGQYEPKIILSDKNSGEVIEEIKM